MTEANTARFNKEAEAWDSNATVQEASQLALEALLRHVPGLEPKRDGGLDVLEIGCGTGILSFLMAPHVRSLCGVDAAQGMITAFRSKLQSRPEIKNLSPVYALLEDPDDSRIQIDPLDMKQSSKRRFDLITSHLVLHHIPSLEGVLQTMYGCLKPGGMVALTDFEDFGPEARRFHPEGKMAGVERHGIARGAMRDLLEQAGFRDVRIETAFEMQKNVEKVPLKGMGEDNVEPMMFPFLICLGTRPA